MQVLKLPIVLALAGALLARGARAQEEPSLTAEQVRTAIRQGTEYLLNEQSPRGTWDEMAQYPGGVSALCTLALLNAGVPPTDPKIEKSLAYLRGLQLTKTYTVSLQTMALAAGSPRRDAVLIQRNVDWLERIQLTKGDRAGSWSYGDELGGDNSNSQFAVLALNEAERVGAKVKPQTWQMAADYWKRVQEPSGAWGYQPGLPGSGSMTCAGIGAWVICSGKVAPPAAKLEGGAVQCCLPPGADDTLERAIVWMGRNFSVGRNPGAGGVGWHLYYLYGLERVGRMTARRFIGDHDWYREGAELLVKEQDPFSHHWQGRGHAEDNPHIATALALLFLSKGRRPVLIAKLRHGPDLDWNNHSSDMANLVGLCEQQWGLDMTWQVIDPGQATVDDLLQAPVLFLSGSKDPELTGQEQKFRDYIDRGGFLFAEACCVDGSKFDEGLRKFLDKVFPEGEYKLRVAEPSHPIWQIDKLVRPESPYIGKLYTVEYGCRTCVVFSEVDLSCYWELYGRGRLNELPAVVRERIEDANAIGLNVLAYATNREPKGKEASFAALDAENVDALGGRGTIRIAKLVHGGGSNDAPGSLVNLLRAAAQGDLRLQVDLREYDVKPSDPALKRFMPLAFMHGRHDFHFTDEERKNLREYLTNGGTLLADAICGSKEFAAAFRREIALVLPDAPLKRVPNDHPLLGDAGGTRFDIHEVTRREPAGGEAGQGLRARLQKAPPELEGAEIDGRLAVVFSPYDISCALEQHEALQCRGYTREDAARIGLNVLMYALNPDVGAVEKK
jgi:hypothetical protein